MLYNKENMKDGEEVYWQGKPSVPACNVRTVMLYLIPSAILLCIWSGISGIEEYIPQIKDALVFLQENIFVKYLVLLLILGLMLQPVLRWFLYYKRIEYVFTNRRALAYYRDSQEIEFEIEASAIPDMKKTPARAGLINLHAVIEEQGELQEARGETQYVKVGFEGVPANILERYT